MSNIVEGIISNLGSVYRDSCWLKVLNIDFPWLLDILVLPAGGLTGALSANMFGPLNCINSSSSGG